MFLAEINVLRTALCQNVSHNEEEKVKVKDEKKKRRRGGRNLVKVAKRTSLGLVAQRKATKNDNKGFERTQVRKGLKYASKNGYSGEDGSVNWRINKRGRRRERRRRREEEEAEAKDVKATLRPTGRAWVMGTTRCQAN